MLYSPTMRDLSLLLVVAPIVHGSTLLHSRQLQALGYPIYHNGPYPFIGCTESQGQTLVDLFKKTGEILSNQVIPSLSNYAQDPRQDAFRTFFSTNSRATVQDVFQKFADRPKYVNLGTEKYAPSIICLNKDSTAVQLQVPKTHCDSPEKPYAFTYGPVPSQGKDIFLCPIYFSNLKAFPDPGENCPTMLYRTSSTRFHLHSNAVENRFGILIHELAHIYVPNHEWGSSEIYDLNAIINAYSFFGMTAEHQLNNANNYAYYAVFVYLGCKDLPLSSKSAGKNKRDAIAGFNTTDPIPNVLEDVSFTPGSFDGDQLQASLTALGF